MPPRRVRIRRCGSQQPRQQRTGDNQLQTDMNPHDLALRLLPAFFAFKAPYLFCACFSQAICFFLDLLSFLHSFRAFASFCARVSVFDLTSGLDADGLMLPAPENVSLGPLPKISGCGAGAAL